MTRNEKIWAYIGVGVIGLLLLLFFWVMNQPYEKASKLRPIQKNVLRNIYVKNCLESTNQTQKSLLSNMKISLTGNKPLLKEFQEMSISMYPDGEYGYSEFETEHENYTAWCSERMNGYLIYVYKKK